MSTSPAPRTPPLHTPDKEPQMSTAARAPQTDSRPSEHAAILDAAASSAHVAILDAAARIPRMEFSPGPLTVPAPRLDTDRLKAAEAASDLLGTNPTAADIVTLAEYLCGGPVPLPR